MCLVELQMCSFCRYLL